MNLLEILAIVAISVLTSGAIQWLIDKRSSLPNKPVQDEPVGISLEDTDPMPPPPMKHVQARAQELRDEIKEDKQTGGGVSRQHIEHLESRARERAKRVAKLRAALHRRDEL